MDLSRVSLVIGDSAVELLRQSTVAVFGLGGVGSYAVEALARSGIGRLLLFDADVIEQSNLNRQLPALVSTVGQPKVEIVKRRVADINPECEVVVLQSFYQPGDFERFITQKVDYIVDAIDFVPAKVDILLEAKKRDIPIVSAMGTGNRLNPTKLEVADIGKTKVCPLARAVRKQQRLRGLERGVQVVYSQEEPQKAKTADVPGSMAFVPGTAGLILASVVVRGIVKL